MLKTLTARCRRKHDTKLLLYEPSLVFPKRGKSRTIAYFAPLYSYLADHMRHPPSPKKPNLAQQPFSAGRGRNPTNANSTNPPLRGGMCNP